MFWILIVVSCHDDGVALSSQSLKAESMWWALGGTTAAHHH
jgi:hypothetical protein